jgi:cyclophilin family peptidyl-prolyl cis-trans isomerase
MLEGASPLRSAATAALASLLLLSPLQMSPTSPFMPTIAAAEAKELPSGSGSRVNKDPLSLLRLGLPAQSKEMRELQKGLEECQDNSARLLNSNAVGALAKAQGVASGKAAALVKGVPSEYSAKAQALVSELDSGMATLKSQLAAGSSEASKTNAALLEKVSELEGLVVLGYNQPMPPKEYAELPYLTRRATVEFTFKKPDGSSFDIDRTLFKVATMRMVVDGYTAPITGGNFVDLVQRGFYDGMKIQRSDGFVVQTGDPSAEGRGKENGFVGDGGKVRRIPLEVYPMGDKAPLYEATFDDDGRGGYAAALPFNAYGALGSARGEDDINSASSQFFWLPFDSDLTPAGKNLLDGRYTCFGYTVQGAEFLTDLKEGDIIASAKVIEGGDRLVKPAGAPAAAVAE